MGLFRRLVGESLIHGLPVDAPGWASFFLGGGPGVPFSYPFSYPFHTPFLFLSYPFHTPFIPFSYRSTQIWGCWCVDFRKAEQVTTQATKG